MSIHQCNVMDGKGNQCSNKVDMPTGPSIGGGIRSAYICKDCLRNVEAGAHEKISASMKCVVNSIKDKKEI